METKQIWEEKLREMLDVWLETHREYTDVEKEVEIDDLIMFVRATVCEALDECKVEKLPLGNDLYEGGYRSGFCKGCDFERGQCECGLFNAAIDAFETKKQEVRKRFE